MPSHLRRGKSPFRTTFVEARSDLLRELSRLGAMHPVISSWLAVRNDGLPRAEAARMRIEDPGVAVYFLRGKRQLVIARDVYSNVHDNLRSIGLAISHLRGLERHGGATMMDRAFEGFAALPPPDKPWWEVLGIPRESEPFMIDAAYRHRSKTAHPDTGGSEEAMSEINAARDAALKEIEGRR